MKVRGNFIAFWWRTNFLNARDYFQRLSGSTTLRIGLHYIQYPQRVTYTSCQVCNFMVNDSFTIIFCRRHLLINARCFPKKFGKKIFFSWWKNIFLKKIEKKFLKNLGNIWVFFLKKFWKKFEKIRKKFEKISDFFLNFFLIFFNFFSVLCHPYTGSSKSPRNLKNFLKIFWKFSRKYFQLVKEFLLKMHF